MGMNGVADNLFLVAEILVAYNKIKLYNISMISDGSMIPECVRWIAEIINRLL